MSCHRDGPLASGAVEESEPQRCTNRVRRSHALERHRTRRKFAPDARPARRLVSRAALLGLKLLLLVGLLGAPGEWSLVRAHEFSILRASGAPDAGQSGRTSLSGPELHEPARTTDENEAQQLRQLHQVVDTVAHLLNEEQQQQQQQQRRRRDEHDQAAQHQLAALQPGDALDEAASEQQVSFAEPLRQQPQSVPAELMSESAIRHAIEELERVQQQERQRQEQETLAAGGGDDERRQPARAQPNEEPAGNIKRNDKQQRENQAGAQHGPSAGGLESLIGELDEQLLDDQIAAASQDAERLVVQQQARRSDESQSPGAGDNNNRDSESDKSGDNRAQITAGNKSDVSVVSASSAPVPSATGDEGARPSLVVGQLNSADSSELGSAMTQDFYSFHAESMGAQGAGPAADTGQQRDSSADEQQPKSQAQVQARVQAHAGGSWADESGPQASGSESPTKAQSDLDSAAQTRSAQRRDFDGRPQALEPQGQGSSVSLEFSQPAPQPGRERQAAPGAGLQQDQLLRAFRPSQLGAEQAQQQPQQFQFQTSTLVPFSASNFWRPSGAGDDFSEQYNRAIGQPGAGALPPLPPARFQSIAPPSPFLPAPQQPQPQHVHFTGHSFSTSDAFQGAGAGPSQRQNFPFASTPQPIISVMSGSEPIGTNSVSWNPPAAIGQPVQAPSPQQPAVASSTARAPLATPFRSAPPLTSPPSQFSQPAFEPPQGGRSDELGQDAPAPTESAGGPTEPPPREFAPPSSSPASGPQTQRWVPSAASVSTQAPLQRPTTLSSVAGGGGSTGAPAEREAADSQPRPTVRAAQQPGRRQPSFADPTTISPFASSFGPPAASPDEPLPGRRGQQLAASSTELPGAAGTRPLAAPTGEPDKPAAKPADKKDDMVIYYYYYYDDNKNATVVAKNISAHAPGSHINGASMPLDASGALEGDGGLEDTPYMDDPVAGPQPPAAPSAVRSNLGPSINLQPVPDGQRSAAGSTATSTSSSVSSTTSQAGRPRQHSHGHREPAARPQSPRTATSPHLVPANSDESQPDLEAEQPESDQQGPGARLEDARPSGRPVQGHRPEQFGATPPSEPAVVTSQRQQAPRGPGHQEQFPGAVGARAQQPGRAAQPQQIPASAGRQQVASAPASANRGSLSNASRYGTSASNQFLDPYGMDPVPAQPGHQEAPAAHHQSPKLASGQTQTSRRPVPTNLDSVERVTPGTRVPAGQHFSPQRQQPTQPQQAHHQQQQHQQPQQPQPARQAQQPQAQAQSQPQVSRNSQPAAARQPQHEVAAPLPPPQQQQPSERAPSSLAPRPQSLRQPVQVAQQPARPTSGPRELEDADDKDELTRVDPQPRLPAPLAAATGGSQRGPTATTTAASLSNGRPSSSDGNTGNGFTRAPPTLTFSSTQPSAGPGAELRFSGPSGSRQSGDSLGGASLSPRVSITSSSSSSSSSGTPVSMVSSQGSGQPQQTHAATSASPAGSTTAVTPAPQPTQQTSRAGGGGSTPKVTAMISGTAPSEPAATPAPPTATTTEPSTRASTTSASSTAGPTQAQETSPSGSTESADPLGASTRRKFGNRNNRFQTRLSAARASSTTTTSTTPPPAGPTSTTTRRPLASTTRKTSKQLFAGRRRLSGLGGNSAAPAPAEPAASNSGELASAPISTEAPPTSRADGNSQSSPISASRARFGNNFTARSRSTTSAPPQAAGPGQRGAGSDSGAKPAGLFSGARATARPRLPFLKGSAKPASEEEASTGGGAPTSSEPATGGPSSPRPEVVPTGSPAPVSAAATISGAEPTRQTDAPGEQGAGQPTPPPLASPSPSPVTSNGPPVQPGASTSSPATTAGEQQPSGARTKPKRPLFASRQRSSSLFGNRRPSPTDTTNTTQSA